jgi:outer membrane protein
MIRLKLPVLLLIALLIPMGTVWSQGAKIAVVDFERAIIESAEGKESSAKFNVKLQEKQKEAENRQKALEAIQTRLQTQDKVLSDAVKAGLQRDLQRGQTDLTRLNEDAQKELETMRNELLQPIAQRASALLQAFAAEQSYTVVIDVSNPETNVVWHNPRNDITAELVRRIDASAPKPAAKPEAAKPPEPKPTK